MRPSDSSAQPLTLLNLGAVYAAEADIGRQQARQLEQILNHFTATCTEYSHGINGALAQPLAAPPGCRQRLRQLRPAGRPAVSQRRPRGQRRRDRRGAEAGAVLHPDVPFEALETAIYRAVLRNSYIAGDAFIEGLRRAGIDYRFVDQFPIQYQNNLIDAMELDSKLVLRSRPPGATVSTTCTSRSR